MTVEYKSEHPLSPIRTKLSSSLALLHLQQQHNSTYALDLELGLIRGQSKESGNQTPLNYQLLKFNRVGCMVNLLIV